MPPQDPTTPREHAIDIRVRYCECDPMGVAHHSVFAVWFEMGRTELLRQTGQAYRDLEAEGVLLAVVSLQVKFRLPARYDDVLTLTTRLVKTGHVKIEHDYELRRGSDVLATASTTLACLDRDGRARALPADLSEWPALISEKTA
ncbi:MAG: thioesterase family protein [Phycisphaerae bacterium]|nr:thioesterase family protein [Phycisphaerae bacterium]